jgi:hypothetical protein
MKTLYKIFFCLIALLLWHNSNAQDTLQISQILKVNRGETLKIKPGTIVLFKPGARLWVDGSLTANGTPEQPIQFVSEYKNKPGTGIVINGIDVQNSIHITNSKFIGLLQPISFEPYWSRKEVILDGLSFMGSDFSEAVVFVAAPLSNLNEDPIAFKLTNSKFYNNKSGIIIENAGASGIRHELDHLIFEDNLVEGNDTTLGIMHLNIAAPYFDKNLRLGNIAFNRNLAGGSQIGLSISGSSENILAKGLYTAKKERLVYDYFADPRLPILKSPVNSLADWPSDQCFIIGIEHLPNTINLFGNKVCRIAYLLDSTEVKLPHSEVYKPDSIQIKYSNGIAKYVVTNDGLRITIPSLIRNDTTPEIKPDPSKLLLIDTLMIMQKEEPFIPSYEAGVWGGLANYVGDIRHKFGIPGLFEWSGGLYVQYNRKRNWSYRGSFYRTNIGMHDPTAPLMIWQGAPLFVSNNNTIYKRLSYDANFKTKMYILDFDAIYYFWKKHDYQMTQLNDNKGHFIPAIGFGVGFMRFDPYRCVVYNKKKDSAEFMALRPLGMEGQNFLQNKKGYGPYTVNFNISLQLAYIYKNFRFRYELKTVLSMSDYIDDYGQGYTYGGNYDKWKASLGELDLPINKATGKQVTMEQAFTPYNTTIIRTNNLLPDMYFQHHIGVSYDLGGLIKNVKKIMANRQN